ncbi:MAG: hypothetical protein A2655_01595 [Candidatus Yanofskybacteria bacterium RIFCSPHIGHO2_01_FULL_43_42]|uniref:GIY-YIG domain-containing protein n=1 Tax=Candidatus Yanofskybacteria bacterium RIFCSPLOWO2_01_FULL_43_22 TaxID=1802695 RepID=A0A1F8GIP5_9BACT|nr:MAG: hypothetical protein A2655_01595 [Candidatus Yanofskybacteria bacterium RIFCSPHIGHO2_01_FULL_43_42]OGN13174.1 MAG: hypothetical protein A3D48_02505 [Candidatus Yanofskybacteria bacterium RIFCSPHIGHO2_02_FULL_43_17]OGN24588.1 MAG: hypothetical protein A3A13_00725 [Candidatus Yanofskybacteria bacterium RIFCSPLOWO2_01_FULL_43_22]
MPFVYILKSLKDGRYYIGSTINIQQRLKSHQDGYNHSTKRMGRLELVLYQEYDTIQKARKIEIKLKRLKRHDYIDKIVKDGHINIRP